jgi:uncharacterized protein YwbE
LGSKGGSTQGEHMPRNHREHAEWTPQRLVRWAEQTGPNTAGVIRHILEQRIHPPHGYRACLVILRLGKTHGAERRWTPSLSLAGSSQMTWLDSY